MADLIQIRRDTAANWTSANPTLAQGELGVETDTLKFKVGDGSTAWNSVNYLITSTSGNVVSTDGVQTLTNKTLKDYAIDGSAIGNTGATRTFDLEVANFFSATLDQNSTFTFSNPPASGDFGAFVLELTNGGAFTITFPAAVDWPGGTAPSLTASGVDQLVFTTRDAGTTWFGFVAGLDIKSPA